MVTIERLVGLRRINGKLCQIPRGMDQIIVDGKRVGYCPRRDMANIAYLIKEHQISRSDRLTIKRLLAERDAEKAGDGRVMERFQREERFVIGDPNPAKV